MRPCHSINIGHVSVQHHHIGGWAAKPSLGRWGENLDSDFPGSEPTPTPTPRLPASQFTLRPSEINTVLATHLNFLSQLYTRPDMSAEGSITQHPPHHKLSALPVAKPTDHQDTPTHTGQPAEAEHSHSKRCVHARVHKSTVHRVGERA